MEPPAVLPCNQRIRPSRMLNMGPYDKLGWGYGANHPGPLRPGRTSQQALFER